jgi:hypothetical protein
MSCSSKCENYCIHWVAYVRVEEIEEPPRIEEIWDESDSSGGDRGDCSSSDHIIRL